MTKFDGADRVGPDQAQLLIRDQCGRRRPAPGDHHRAARPRHGGPGCGCSYGGAAQNAGGCVLYPVTSPAVEVDVEAATVRVNASTTFHRTARSPGSARAAATGTARHPPSHRGRGDRCRRARQEPLRGRMTSGMIPAPMATTPAPVGQAVATALAHRDRMVWIPRSLAFLATAMRLTPHPFWRRLRH